MDRDRRRCPPRRCCKPRLQPRRPARKRGKGDGPPKRRGEPAGAVCWCWPGLCRKSAPLARIMPPPHLITFFRPRLSRKNATIPKCSAGGRVVWRRAVVAASSLFSCVVLLAALLTTDSARGADLPPSPPPPPPPVVPVYKAPDPILSVFYTGGAFNWVHHTGSVPNSTQADTAQYTVGFKVFGGYRFTRQNSVEVTYHYLGQVNIEGLPIPTTERAWAISGSFVQVSPPFSQWIGPGPWNDYLHAFVRLGLAYKHVEQSSALGTIDEG